MKSVRYIFKAVKLANLYGVVFLSYNFCEWYIATFISLFALLSVSMQKEETESDWLEYVDEEE